MIEAFSFARCNMPLMDHFHPPLAPKRHWDSFHSAWAGAMADLLNQQLLPEDYFAEELTQAGSRVEIDVATFQDDGPFSPHHNGAAATLATQIWRPPAPAHTMPSVAPASFSVLVFANDGGAKLVAAVELVSPANKDRPETRRAFAVKCANFLYQGISLIVVDIVTNRTANLHNDLIDLMQTDSLFALSPACHLYAVAYRPIHRAAEEIDVWPHALGLHQPLPILPLALNAQVAVPLDLESTYQDACRRRRLP